jgi:hypothetical protein
MKLHGVRMLSLLPAMEQWQLRSGAINTANVKVVEAVVAEIMRVLCVVTVPIDKHALSNHNALRFIQQF